MVVHGKEKWKEINEVRYSSERGHDTKARWYTSQDQQLRRSNGGGNGGGRQ